jgi:glyoxylase-like metal-dependent hydrolase (beta-lactamase superfamily II)
MIDTGLGRTIAEQMREFPFLFRLGTDLVRLQAAADQLDATGYDRRQLRYILLTHAHWDHISGVPDFPGVPVLVTAAERRFIDEGGWETAHARSMNAVFQEYAFDGGPYMGFTQFRDLYGDGSIVIVPAPGHTPGSVVVFVTLPGGARHAFVGDLVWQLEGLLEREERPWFEARTLGENPVLLRQSLLRIGSPLTSASASSVRCSLNRSWIMSRARHTHSLSEEWPVECSLLPAITDSTASRSAYTHSCARRPGAEPSPRTAASSLNARRKIWLVLAGSLSKKPARKTPSSSRVKRERA